MKQFIKNIAPEVEITVAEDWMWDREAYPEEEAYITRAVEKRKREFRAGRHSAHSVLRHFGIEDFPVKVGHHRQPLWPQNIIGSISHTDGFCACVATPRDSIISIGIDVEPMEKVDVASLPLICTRRELQSIEAYQPETAIPLCKLIFSAKECVHKVYHPLNDHTLDFLDAEISFDIPGKRFTAKITNPEKRPRHPIKRLEGFFEVDDNYLFTLILKKKE